MSWGSESYLYKCNIGMKLLKPATSKTFTNQKSKIKNLNMKNTLATAKSHRLKHSNTRDAVASLRLVVFEMGNLKLALRIDTVYKVLNQTPIYGTGFNDVGIAYIGDREVTVVELHRRFFAAKGSYLIVVQNESELYGIPVVAVPVLMEVPLSSIQVLSENYRHADVLGEVATHVCHIAQGEATLTIFLLDVGQLLPSS